MQHSNVLNCINPVASRGHIPAYCALQTSEQHNALLTMSAESRRHELASMYRFVN